MFDGQGRQVFFECHGVSLRDAPGLWEMTEFAPISPERGETVAVSFLNAAGVHYYGGADEPDPSYWLCKRVCAVDGDMVEADGQQIFINGELVRIRHPQELVDQEAKWLTGTDGAYPYWTGRRRLLGEVFLLSDLIDDLLTDMSTIDSRYLGPVPTRLLAGKIKLRIPIPQWDDWDPADGPRPGYVDTLADLVK
jgi:type IV secretory pathway protease TraF